MGDTNIEWTNLTWNPVTGCTKISSGCKNCYAEQFAKRLKAMKNRRYKNGFKVTLHWDKIEDPLKWRKPRLVFVNSMSDLFHDKVPLEFIEKVFSIVKKADSHIFQILTKRSERLKKVAGCLEWPENLWIGVSVENQDTIYRIDDLRQVPWVRIIRDRCRQEDIPFFFKQWGGRTPKAGGRTLDGEIWDEYPESNVIAR